MEAVTNQRGDFYSDLCYTARFTPNYYIDVMKLAIIIAIPLKNGMTVIGQFHNIDV